MKTLTLIIPYIAATAAALCISVQLAIEVDLNKLLKNGNYHVAVIAFGTAFFILLIYGALTGTRLQPTWTEFQSMHWTQYWGGLIRLAYLVLTVFAATRLGIATTTCILIGSQVIFAGIIQSNGLLGSPLTDWNWQKSVGAFLIILGVVFMVYKKV